jgi:glucose-1-phosphate adenylyltransferase
MANEPPVRFVSRLTRDSLALIMAGGRGTRLGHMTLWRAKPAVPFAGKFRLIDFPLSNCINSGVRRIGVLTQYKAHSLIQHIQRGWGFLRGEFGEFVELLPAQQRIETSWYAGTADAVYQNLDIVLAHEPSFVLILAGDHIYKMDYGPMLAYHVEHEADITVGCIEVPRTRAAGSFGVMTVDPDWRIRHFVEKPQDPQPLPGRTDLTLASMGIYVFSTEFLRERLMEDARNTDSRHDFGGDVIPSAIEKYRVYGYPFRDPASGRPAYWRDVGTIDAFWESNLELVEIGPELNLYDASWPIWTYQEQLPSAKFVLDEDGRRGMAVNSMVSGGCIISGAYVRHSLLFSNVRVEEGARVVDSVVLPDVRIGPGCRINKALIERGCHLPAGTIVGEDAVQDAQRFHVTRGGVTLVMPNMLGQEIHHVL